MRRESSPRESQWRWMSGSAAARALMSGSVSSMMAATTTVRLCARAASSRRKGKRPLPAIRPSFCIVLTLAYAFGIFGGFQAKGLPRIDTDPTDKGGLFWGLQLLLIGVSWGAFRGDAVVKSCG